MLAADWIRYYAELVQMIYPFEKELLKPSSYSLTLGPLFQINGRDGVLTPEEPVLEIPKNSIVFVSMAERIRLPHYIAARFNLKIDLIYKGLLLGTGPQVDPGFQGVLSCPLHNISNWPIRIQLGHHFATIDFIKTTGIAEQAREVLEGIQDEDELYRREPELVGRGGNRNYLFSRDKRWTRPIVGYPPGDFIVESSVQELERAVFRFRLFGLGGAVAALALLVTTLAFFLDLHGDIKAELDSVREMSEEAEESDQVRSQELTRLEEQLSQLRERLDRQEP